MNYVIETRDLVKRYKDVAAVDRVSLRVVGGEIYAFLGLNGAGKTTTIRMLLGMVKPTSGGAHVLGYQIQRGERRPWKSVGYLVETPHAYPELTVRENLEATRRLRPGTDPAAVSRIIEQLALIQYADRRTDTLSLGNAQRLGLAKALLHNPSLLILDEPTNGLDPAGIVEIRNFLIELVRTQGITVFLSSHLLGEVSRLADRIGIIHQGRLVQELNTAELERNRKRHLEIRAQDMHAAQTVLQSAGIATLLRDQTLRTTDERALAHPEQIATLLVNANQPPTLLKVEQEDLEHYFLRLIGVEPRNTQERADG